MKDFELAFDTEYSYFVKTFYQCNYKFMKNISENKFKACTLKAF